MFSRNWRRHAPLQTCLVKERQMMSLMEKEMVIVTGELVWDDENWVRMWVDTGNGVVADSGQCVAFRGISDAGELMWLVRHHKRRHGYHSIAQSPHDAIAEAEAAWAERARVKSRWPQVKAIARDLILGRRNFKVTRADAHRSALCSAGIDAFMNRMNMGKTQEISGRLAAILMLLEPQLGFVIYAGYERILSERASPEFDALPAA